jgi:hypothetical protein
VADLDTVHAVSDAEPVADGALAPTIPDLAEKPDEPAAATSWPDPSLVGPVLSPPPPTTAPSPRLAPPLLRVCPNCGRTRLGQFRYCLTCGFDYDVAERASSVRPWLTNVTQAEPVQTEQRVLIRTPIREPELEPLPPPVLPPEPPPPSGAINVGAGRFTVSRGVLIAGAIGVGVAAAILVSLFALVLGRLF